MLPRSAEPMCPSACLESSSRWCALVRGRGRVKGRARVKVKVKVEW